MNNSGGEFFCHHLIINHHHSTRSTPQWNKWWRVFVCERAFTSFLLTIHYRTWWTNAKHYLLIWNQFAVWFNSSLTIFVNDFSWCITFYYLRASNSVVYLQSFVFLLCLHCDTAATATNMKKFSEEINRHLNANAVLNAVFTRFVYRQLYHAHTTLIYTMQ